MGNKSSSNNYPYWNHPAYPAHYDGKRGMSGTPGVYIEPYVPHFHRSMVSLHDSGYMTSPGGTMADANHRTSRIYGSRMSLNQMVVPPPPPPMGPIPDSKTMKKLEKMQKKHDKLVKKLVQRGHAYGTSMPMGGPQPPVVQHRPQVARARAPMYPYQRAMSFDDLQRAQLDMAEMRLREEWRKAHPIRESGTINISTVSSNSTCIRTTRGNGSLTSSSPVTSSSEGRTAEQWNSFGSSHEKNNFNLSENEKNNNNSNKYFDKSNNSSPVQNMQVPKYMSTPKSSPKQAKENVHNIVVKVEKSGKTEFTKEERVKHNDNMPNPPIIHQRDQSSFGSRSSMATSQFRCDQSEIDFSWVTEEEDRLRSEKNRIDSLPECYFGIEPRLPSSSGGETPAAQTTSSSSKDGKENHRSSVVKQTASMFEEEARRIRSRDQQTRDDQSIELRTEFNLRSGPVERRLNRIQPLDSTSDPRERTLWRTSIAF